MLSSWTWGEDDCLATSRNDSKGVGVGRRAANRAAGRVLKMQHRFVQIANSLCAQLHGDIGSSESIPEVTALYAAHADKVVWGAWPTSVHPRGGDIPETRCARKEEQVKAMVSALSFVIDTMQRSRPRRLRFVEFCAGSGYVALPLACLYPALQLTVLDLKEQSVQRARRRVLLSGLRNVEVRLQDISTFDEEFDVGASLHACGSLSDQVLQKCVERRAAFVICPCCIGKVLFTRDAPLSHRFAGLLAPRDFKRVLRAADSHHRDDEEEEGDEGGLALASQGSADSTLVCGRLRCKLLVEEDRRLYAQEQGYEHTLLVRMKETASPKRDIVLGWVDGAL